jgi:hypothetical protein
MGLISSLAAQLRWLGISVLLAGGAAAYGADSYSGGKLTLPTLVVGNATYSGVVVTLGSILSGPAGNAPIGTVDTYNPANGQLTLQAVTVGSITVYNVVVTVSSLVSIGGVSGADTYNGSTVLATMVSAGASNLSYATFRPTGAPTIAGGMPNALYDSFNGTTLSIPALGFAGRVFTNISVPASQQSVAGTDQTITITKPVPPINPLSVGTSEAISATASSGLPVTFVVTTPSVCAVVQASAQQGYGYFGYTATGGSGSGVVGAAPLGGGAFQADWVTGETSNGQPLGLARASSVLNPYPSNGQFYTPPYPNFVLGGVWFFDDVLLASGGARLDLAGILLTAPDDQYINLLYNSNTTQYLYGDSIILAAMGNYQAMTFSASVVNGLVGLSSGGCTIKAFQPGSASFSAAAPVQITVDVGFFPQ